MAVLAPPDWLYPSRDPTMELPSNPRQRSSPANEHAATPPTHHPQHLQQQLGMSQQQQQHQQQPGYPYPVQQQPQGSWTPSIAAAPFYPSFYQNHGQQSNQAYPSPISPISTQPPYFDPAANAQLAQWAYQQMMFNAQHGYSQMTPQHHTSQRSGSITSGSNDYFSQGQIPAVFNPFPSGTPPPHVHRGAAGDHQPQVPQGGQYPGYHPYRRPARQHQQPSDTSDRRNVPGNTPHPPYTRSDAAASTSSVNSSSSQRQRTNSNQSGHSTQNASTANGSVRGRSNISPVASSPSSARSSPTSASSSTSANQNSMRIPHHRNSSSSSSASTTSSRPSGLSPSLPTTATSSASSGVSTTVVLANPRPARPSPLSQGNFTASDRRMSKDDSDLAAMMETTPNSGGHRSGGLKGRLRRALSFNASQTLQEEADDDEESIKASKLNRNVNTDKAKEKMPITINPAIGKPSISGDARSPDSGTDYTVSSSIVPPKKKGRAASLFNSRLNASTDNISLSSTVSSASVMIRKLGSMGKLARRNSLAGITSLFKDKDKDKNGEGKGKKKDKDKKSAKAEASVASVSHVTAELDRSSSGDWNAGGDLNGLSPAATLARQHTLKSNAEAAARAKAQQESQAASAAAISSDANAGLNGAGVPAWDKNTTTRQGSASPVKGMGGGVRVNEDGMRVFVEDDDEESDDGHPSTQPTGDSLQDGWDEEDDWDVDGEGDEDMTIRVGMERTSLDDEGLNGRPSQDEVEPWAVDIRRSVEKAKRPMRGILKYAGTYDQQSFLVEQPNPNRVRSNSYTSPPVPSELGPLARIPSPDPDHIDGLHRHPSHSSSHSTAANIFAPSLPPLPFESSPRQTEGSLLPKELPDTPTQTSHNQNTHHTERPTSIFQHPNLNSSAPTLSTIMTSMPSLPHRSATAPNKRLTFDSNLSVYDTFSSSVYDRRSEPATWSRLTPALAQRIKEELNSYKMEEMEVHAASRIHTQFFV